MARVRTVFGQALDTALRRGKVARNVARLAEMPRTSPPPEKRSLTLEQARALLEAAKGDPCEAFITTGLMLGLRPGELLGLRWADIDFKAHRLTVSGSLKREGGRMRLGDTKTRGSRRTLTMPDPVEGALRAHRKSQAAVQLAAGPEVWSNPDGLVFTSEVGTPLHTSNMNRKLAPVTERAGLGHWSMTELARHSAASLMSAAGVPLEMIADALGHTSTRMLEQHYRHQVRPSIDAHVRGHARAIRGDGGSVMLLIVAAPQASRGITDADCIRWVGVAVGVIGAGVAASNGVRLMWARARPWVANTGRWLRGHLARWLPFLRRSATVLAGTASARVTAGLGTVVVRGGGWDPFAAVRQQTGWLHRELETLRQDLTTDRDATRERFAAIDARLTTNHSEALQAVAHLTQRMDTDAIGSARTDARGLVLVAVAIIFTGIPAGLARWTALGVAAIVAAGVLTVWTISHVWRHPA